MKLFSEAQKNLLLDALNQYLDNKENLVFKTAVTLSEIRELYQLIELVDKDQISITVDEG